MEGADQKSEGITITSKWMEELTKYPYFSSKLYMLRPYRKTWYRYIPDEGEIKSQKDSRYSQGVLVDQTHV